MSERKRGILLVVDDETEMMHALCEALPAHCFEVKGITSPDMALEAVRNNEPDVMLCELIMPHIDGIDLLKQAMVIDPNLIGIIMTGQGTVQTAVEAMKSGAFDYVLKPFRLQQIVPVLNRAMEFRRLRLENAQLKRFVERLSFELPSSAILAGSYDLESLLRRQVQFVLNEMQGNKVHAAKALGVSRRSLYRLIEKYGLESGKPEREAESSESQPSSSLRHPANC